MLFFCGLMLFSVCTALGLFLGASDDFIYDRFDRIYFFFLAFGAFVGFVCCLVDMVIQNIMLEVGTMVSTFMF